MRREAAKRKLANQQAHRADRARKRKRTATIASIVTVVVVVVAVVAVYALSGNGSTTAPEATPPPATGPDTSGLPVAPLPTRPTALPASVNCAYPAAGAPAKPATPPAPGAGPGPGAVPGVVRSRARGLGGAQDRARGAGAGDPFLNLAKQGYFDDTPCHRLTTGEGLQVLQCGDPTGAGTGGPGYSFADEVFEGLKYGRGMLAMANSGPDTNGSPVFMIYGDAQLPPNYSVFGSIDAGGLATLDKIAKAGDDSSNGDGDGAPNTPVTIWSATTGP